MSLGYAYPPPLDGKPFRLNMGLRALEPSAWLEGGDDLDAQIPERLTLAETSREIVYQEMPGYEKTVAELAGRIVEHLMRHHTDCYTFTENTLIHRATEKVVRLDSASILLDIASIIGEDLVVLSREDDEWKIVAGAVLYPSRWKLVDKVGKGMDAVHEPVPGFASALAPFMTATFDKITADRPVWRKNWSLHSTQDLHQPTSIHADVDPEDYWWRTERQTLTRALDGDFLYFTIRNRAEPLHWIKADTGAAKAFAQTLSTYSPETIEYKGLQRDHQKIVDYLRD